MLVLYLQNWHENGWLLLPCGKDYLFLSYGKYLEHITKSSSKLNSIFPDSDYHICQKKKTISGSKAKKSSREKQIEKNNTLSLSEKGLKNCDLDTSNDFFSECEFSNDCFSDSEVQIQVDEIDKSLKRLLSIDTEEINPSKRATRSKNNVLYDCSFNKEDFRFRIPKWGGELVDGKNTQLNYRIMNSCTIDYFLLSLWACN
jgi:hypothetical protein